MYGCDMPNDSSFALFWTIGGLWVGMSGRRTVCYEKNEAADVLWDEVKEANCKQCRSIEKFDPNKFNKNCEGGWIKEVEVDYGIK